MLTTIKGDLLTVPDGVICHQVNYYGVMGAGVAAAIADSILTAEQYAAYENYCHTAGRTALGTVQFLDCADGRTVANLFSQDESRARSADARDFSITDYDALRRCLIRVRSRAQLQKQRVYIPYKIGCGIAAGDWGVVENVIKHVFESSPVEAFIVRREGR